MVNKNGSIATYRHVGLANVILLFNANYTTDKNERKKKFSFLLR